MPTSPKLSEDEIFESWLASRSDPARAGLMRGDVIRKKESGDTYRWIWKSWCKWLAEPDPATGRRRAPHWLAARPVDVMAFLQNGPSPVTDRTDASEPSKITQRRYLRTLQRVYDRAIELKLGLAVNPADLKGRRGVPPQERSTGAVLNDLVWQALLASLPRGDDWQAARDRAILGLMTELALTPGEVAALERTHVADSMLHPGQLEITILGARTHQERELLASLSLSQDLRRWAQWRAKDSVRGPAGEVTTLFISRANGSGAAPRGPMTKRTLFHLAAKHVAMAYETAQQLKNNEAPGHIGPMVLRNTRLLQWMKSKMPTGEVVRRAGLKDAKSLHRLQAHLPSPSPGQ